jgi:hypothetical protein
MGKEKMPSQTIPLVLLLASFYSFAVPLLSRLLNLLRYLDLSYFPYVVNTGMSTLITLPSSPDRNRVEGRLIVSVMETVWGGP